MRHPDVSLFHEGGTEATNQYGPPRATGLSLGTNLALQLARIQAATEAWPLASVRSRSGRSDVQTEADQYANRQLQLYDKLSAMIFDSHCHAWERWPYPGVDHASAIGSVDALLRQMDSEQVHRALVVCAAIGPNPENNLYASNASRNHGDRLDIAVDIDSEWQASYHKPGSAARLRAEAERVDAVGFTHYLARGNDGWLRTDDAFELFATAEELKLVASISAGPEWLIDLRELARRTPNVPVLLHHMGFPATEPELLEVLACATVPTIGVKVSGFNYMSDLDWDFPYRETHELFWRILAAFGLERLYWGSDFPVSRASLTYRQSIEIVRTVLAGSDARLSSAILGDNLGRLLRRS